MDDDESFDYGSLPEYDQQEFLYDLIGFKDSPADNHANVLFYEAFYNDDMDMRDRLDVMEELSSYLWDEYGIDFEAIWDWDDFREWYGTQ